MTPIYKYHFNSYEYHIDSETNFGQWTRSKSLLQNLAVMEPTKLCLSCISKLNQRFVFLVEQNFNTNYISKNSCLKFI